MSASKERGIIQRVRRSLAEGIGEIGEGLPAGTPLPVVAGYSGGADSLALIVVLRELDRLGLVRLVAVHVDHGVRAESSRDAEKASTIAASLGVAFRSCRIDPEALVGHRGVGLEEAMRRERYRLLTATAQALGVSVLATGHHQRDQAETVLLHLVRGAGLRGAGGMRAWSQLDVPWWDGVATSHVHVWRPLLDESPASLRAMVEAMGLPIIEDPTNEEEDARRNVMRHRILPMLDAIDPGSEANIAAFARRAAEDDAALQEIADACLGVPSRRLDRSVLLAQPLVIQRRMIRRWISTRVPEVDLTAERTEAVLTLARRNTGGKRLEIGAGWTVELRSGVLMLVQYARSA